ncbi:MAG: septal ring lytic transglycosylase RlpA family protein [Sulfurimonas sp.]|nr:septal ring lytic transglycosylase RlpA family protein [Sulfurimonas sp.]
MNKIFLIVLIIFGLFLSGCSTKSRYANYKYSGSETRTYSSNKNDYNTQMSKKAYKHPTMRSYVIYGVRYYPKDVRVGDKFSGNASWYGPDFHGKSTSNGEKYNMYEMTAAHKTLPMNTVVRVVNKKNGLSTVVRINDRGPFIATRIIDLSNTAARKIKMIGAGTAPVTIEVLGFYSKNKRRSTVKPKPIKYKRITTTTSIKHSETATYALQIASFTNIEGAMKIQEQHDNTDGYKTIIKDVQSDSGRLFKVYLRGFESEQEIRDYKENSDFSNSFIVRED